MRLYGYFRSSAAYRVRIALALKGIDYRTEPVNLVKGDQRTKSYLQLNPQGLVPALELDSGEIITQSPAILEWLEERFPNPALYPRDELERARVRALCFSIACDIHPINNLRVLKYLTGELGVNEAAKLEWYRHWIRLGFAAIEAEIEGPFCKGDRPGMADAYLIPQVYNALRFELDLAPFPAIRSVYERSQEHPAFAAAHPDRQADAPGA